MTKLLQSTSVRLALGYAAVFFLSSLALVGVLWWRTTDYLDREINAVIAADVQAIGDQLRDTGLAGAVRVINDRIEETIDEHSIYLLVNSSLDPVTGNLTAWPAKIGFEMGWHQVDLVRDRKTHATRLFHAVLPSGFHLLVGRDIQDKVVMRRLIFEGLSWTAAMAIILAVGGGLLMRRVVHARIEAINSMALEILRGNLSRRMLTKNSTDEFDQLSQTINEMLRQIEVLIEGVRNSSNAIAHDLRTPLAELRGQLEELLRLRPPADVVYEKIQNSVADLDRVIGIFNALLRLAEIKSGERLAGFQNVQLDKMVAEVGEFYRPAAGEKGLSLVVDASRPIGINGDPFLLAQAVGNLLDNAIKYSPPHGEVRVEICGPEGGSVGVAVSDRGPGISDTDKPRVVDRFYRGKAGRDADGMGLGLSVVDAVARLHGGKFVLADGKPGLVATLNLPTPADQTATDSSKQ